VPPLFHSQFPGVLAMGAAVLILFFLPWLDRSPVRSIRYRGAYYKSALAVFVVAFLILGYLGTESTTVWGQFGFDAFFLDTKDRARSEEHTSELQSRGHLVCRLLLEKKK